MDPDRSMRALARLAALRDALDKTQSFYIEERYVREFHEGLDHVARLGQDVEEFRIPDAELQRRRTSHNYMTGEQSFSYSRSVERALMMAKLNAVIGYVEMLVSSKPQPSIGFRNEQE